MENGNVVALANADQVDEWIARASGHLSTSASLLHGGSALLSRATICGSRRDLRLRRQALGLAMTAVTDVMACAEALDNAYIAALRERRALDFDNVDKWFYPASAQCTAAAALTFALEGCESSDEIQRCLNLYQLAKKELAAADGAMHRACHAWCEKAKHAA
jgi:hypothetical protein